MSVLLTTFEYEYLRQCRDALYATLHPANARLFVTMPVEIDNAPTPMLAWVARWVGETPPGVARKLDRRAVCGVCVDSQGVGVCYSAAAAGLLGGPSETPLPLPFTRWHPIDMVRLRLGGCPPVPDFTETAEAIAKAWGLQKRPR